jgi:hypothetical protein
LDWTDALNEINDPNLPCLPCSQSVQGLPCLPRETVLLFHWGNAVYGACPVAKSYGACPVAKAYGMKCIRYFTGAFQTINVPTHIRMITLTLLLHKDTIELTEYYHKRSVLQHFGHLF